MNHFIKKICCGLSMVLMLNLCVGTVYGEKKPFDFNFPIFSNWVVDQKTGVKLLVMTNKEEGEKETVYEWLGDSHNGYATGVGTVNEYRQDVVTTTYTGRFENGKMQGRFTGELYGKITSQLEWYCHDGILNGPLRITDEEEQIQLMIENNKMTEVYLIKNDRDHTQITIKFAEGQPVSAKMNFIQGSYEGGFDKDGMAGTGVLIATDLFVYEGDFANNQFNGQGKLTQANGNVFIGTFVAGSMHGYGTLYNKNGEILKQGNWEKNRFVNSADRIVD